MTISRCVPLLFQLVKSILAVPTISPSFVCLPVLCGCVWPCLQEFMDDGCCEIQWKPKWKSNCSVNVCIWAKIGLVHEYIATFYLHTNGFFHRACNWTYCAHMEKHNNVNTCVCTVSISSCTLAHAHLHTYTAQQTSRCPSLPVKLPFIHVANASPSHFPTESFTPFPTGHWHHSPPILTHSFLLATLCRTPAITAMLPTRLHGSVIDRCWAGCPFQPMADQSQVVMRRPCSDQLSMMLGRRGEYDATGAHKHTHTHSNGSFSNTKYMGSLLGLSVLLWCIIYVAIVWPSL